MNRTIRSLRRATALAIIVGTAAATGVSPAFAKPETPEPPVMISNIMKTKHDTVKNSISNVR